MCWYISILGKLDTVSAHLGDNVFPEYHDLLCTILQPTGITRENRPRNFPPEIFNDRVWNGRPEKWSCIFLSSWLALPFYRGPTIAGLPAPQINKIPWLFPDFSLTKLGFSLTKTTKLTPPPPPLQPANPPISFFSLFFSTKKYYILLNKNALYI